jgi:hypothetical protein
MMLCGWQGAAGGGTRLSEVLRETIGKGIYHSPMGVLWATEEGRMAVLGAHGMCTHEGRAVATAAPGPYLMVVLMSHWMMGTD